MLVHSWHTIQLDYVLAIAQAPVNRNLYMKIPKGFEVEGAKKGEYVFNIKKNTYGQNLEATESLTTTLFRSRKPVHKRAYDQTYAPVASWNII